MSTVTTIDLVLPEIEVHLASSSIDGQLVLNLRSTLVDPVVNVEVMRRGFLRWLEEDSPELDCDKSEACTSQAVYVSKAKNFQIEASITSLQKCSNKFKKAILKHERRYGPDPSYPEYSVPPTDVKQKLQIICTDVADNDGRLDSGVHIFDFHFSFLPSIPTTFTSKTSYAQEDCDNSAMSHSVQRGRLSSGLMTTLVVEGRKDVTYFCCFNHGSVILWISLEKNIFCPGDTIVFMTDIANRAWNYVRKIIFAAHCIACIVA
nr:PREDICTED: arrestin domain-containing protein 5 [Phalacrocorax carbo]